MSAAMILASTTSEELWRWVEHGALALTIVATVIAIKKSQKKERRRIEPDPLRVRKVEPKVSDAVCKSRHELAMEQLDKLADQNREEHQRLYDQIDEVEKRGDDKLTTAMENVNETIRGMPLEMIRLLKDTGQMK